MGTSEDKDIKFAVLCKIFSNIPFKSSTAE